MSEEAKTTEATEAPAAEAPQEAAAATPSKKKKINKFSADEIQKKIAGLEKNNQTGAKYYKHLKAQLALLQG